MEKFLILEVAVIVVLAGTVCVCVSGHVLIYVIAIMKKRDGTLIHTSTHEIKEALQTHTGASRQHFF